MTKNAKHTPGPWTAVQNGPSLSRDSFYNTEIRGADGRSIADLRRNGLNETRGRANATLLAAASDLLAAAKYISDVVFSPAFPGRYDWLDALREAISKATDG